jgi:stage II sporulation protein GA (sporulation sigma-E factor processing peptidase)
MITSYLIGKKLPFYKIIIGGLIAATYVIIIVYQSNDFLTSTYFKLVYSIFIILATFGYQTVNKLLTSLVYFYLSTFTLGGILLGINYFITTSIIYEIGYINIIYKSENISLIFILFCFPIASYLYLKYFTMSEEIRSLTNIIYDVEISFKNSIIKCRGLLDTGNNLSDPLLRLPVIVVDQISIQEQLDDRLIEILKQWEKNMQLPDTENCFVNGIKLIPFSAIGSNNKILIGYVVNYIKIENNLEKYSCEKAIVAFSTTRISAEKNFQCILHQKCLSDVTKIA